MGIFSFIFLNLLETVVDFLENKSLGKLIPTVILPVLALIVGIIGLIKRKKRIGKAKTTFSKEIIEQRKEFFIANHFEIEGGYSSLTDRNHSVNPKINLDRFIKNIFTDSQKLYFIEGGTGIGKTSFLINLFVRYYRKSAWKFWKKKPRLLLINFSALSAMGVEKHNILKYYTDGLREKVILLIDGMDEFSQRPDSDNYWRVFEENWEKLSKDLQQFEKVIITVRSQFFEQDTVDNIFLRNLQNSPFSPHSIKLHPLDDKQADWFLETKFKKEKFDKKYKKIESLIKLLRYRKYDFAHIPLVLNYMGDIAGHYNPDNANSISQYFIFDVIVQSWIKREVEEKIGSSDNYKKEKLGKDLRRFCCFLAYKIYKKQQEQPQIDYKILQSDLQELEKEFNLDQLFTFNSRSLLGKYTTNFYENTRGNFREEYYRYGFIHKAFFEFFLLEYQYIQENESGKVNEIDFTNHTLASEIYIVRRWSEKKDNIPQKYAEEVNLFPKDLNLNGDPSEYYFIYITHSILNQWHIFLFSFTKNKSLESILIEKGVEIVSLQLGEGFGSFEDHFIINNSNPVAGIYNNFWDEDLKRPYYDAFKVIPFFRNFISEIFFYNMELREEHLKCFEKATNIKNIRIWFHSSIQSSSKIKKRFNYFKDSCSSLESIVLSDLAVEDSELLCFQETNKINNLEFEDNCLSGSFLFIFRKSASTLKTLRMEKNPILAKNMEHLLLFKNLEELHIDRGIVDDNHPIYRELRNRGVEITLYENERSDEPPKENPQSSDNLLNNHWGFSDVKFNYTYKKTDDEESK